LAKLVTTAAYLALGAGPTDYSAQVKSCSLTIDAPEVDVTNMDSAGWTELLGGIKKASLAIEWVKDADLSGLDAAVYAALGSTLAFRIRQQDSAIAAGNPEYQGTCLITQWQPINGSVGQAFGGSTTWPVTGAIVRDIEP
jgi:predicted secreted protein